MVILLLVFGARRLPEIGRSLGSGMREFKDSISGDSKPTLSATAQQPPAQQPQPPVAQPAPAPPPVAAPAPAEPVDESTFGR